MVDEITDMQLADSKNRPEQEVWWELVTEAEAREIYHVRASSEEDAKAKLENDYYTPQISEIDGFDVVSVRRL